MLKVVVSCALGKIFDFDFKGDYSNKKFEQLDENNISEYIDKKLENMAEDESIIINDTRSSIPYSDINIIKQRFSYGRDSRCVVITNNPLWIFYPETFVDDIVLLLGGTPNADTRNIEPFIEMYNIFGKQIELEMEEFSRELLLTENIKNLIISDNLKMNITWKRPYIDDEITK